MDIFPNFWYGAYWRSLSFAGGGTLRLIPELSEIIGEFHMNEPLINCRLKLSFVNNTFNGESMTLDIADISIMGVNGVVVGSIPQMYPWFDPGDTVTFDYNLSGIPQSTGQMTIKFENRGYIYIENVDIIN